MTLTDLARELEISVHTLTRFLTRTGVLRARNSAGAYVPYRATRRWFRTPTIYLQRTRPDGTIYHLQRPSLTITPLGRREIQKLYHQKKTA